MSDRTAKNRILYPSSIFALGVIAGVIGTASIADVWPLRLAPVFYAKNPLHFGIAADGRPALCGDDGIAYTPTESGELAYLAHMEGGVMQTQKCRDKTS
jgi:hypothetical protein